MEPSQKRALCKEAPAVTGASVLLLRRILPIFGPQISGIFTVMIVFYVAVARSDFHFK